jgi:hypothetical protein
MNRPEEPKDYLRRIRGKCYEDGNDRFAWYVGRLLDAEQLVRRTRAPFDGPDSVYFD